MSQTKNDLMTILKNSGINADYYRRGPLGRYVFSLGLDRLNILKL